MKAMLEPRMVAVSTHFSEERGHGVLSAPPWMAFSARGSRIVAISSKSSAGVFQDNVRSRVWARLGLWQAAGDDQRVNRDHRHRGQHNQVFHMYLLSDHRLESGRAVRWPRFGFRCAKIARRGYLAGNRSTGTTSPHYGRKLIAGRG